MATSRPAHALSRARLNCVEKSVRSSALALRASAQEQKRDDDLCGHRRPGGYACSVPAAFTIAGELKCCDGTMRLLVLFSQSQSCDECFELPALTRLCEHSAAGLCVIGVRITD
jgi:hypothetical protein